jgi:hypothetical protein
MPWALLAPVPATNACFYAGKPRCCSCSPWQMAQFLGKGHFVPVGLTREKVLLQLSCGAGSDEGLSLRAAALSRLYILAPCCQQPPCCLIAQAHPAVLVAMLLAAASSPSALLIAAWCSSRHLRLLTLVQICIAPACSWASWPLTFCFPCRLAGQGHCAAHMLSMLLGVAAYSWDA